MTRTKLCDRTLPRYSRGEENMNMISHIIGGVLGILVTVSCVLRGVSDANIWVVVSSAIYGASMIILYSVSSVYHGLRPNTAKKVMQVIDHCTIYFLIAGTYTPVLLCAIRPVFPAIGWGLLIFEWALAILACVLTAIDLKKYEVLSMTCYIGAGWAILPFLRQTRLVLGDTGFYLLLSGGIAYTIGAVLYGIGSRKKWMHSVFHIFVVLGSILQFLSIVGYAL